MEYSQDEAPLRRPFWVVDSAAEGRSVTEILRQRFPETYAILSESLEAADPFDIVYPGNPDEYSDVVNEIIVLLAPVHGNLESLTRVQVDAVVREGIGRRFGEEPDEEKVRKTVDLIMRRSR